MSYEKFLLTTKQGEGKMLLVNKKVLSVILVKGLTMIYHNEA